MPAITVVRDTKTSGSGSEARAAAGSEAEVPQAAEAASEVLEDGGGETKLAPEMVLSLLKCFLYIV